MAKGSKKEKEVEEKLAPEEVKLKDQIAVKALNGEEKPTNGEQ